MALRRDARTSHCTCTSSGNGVPPLFTVLIVTLVAECRNRHRRQSSSRRAMCEQRQRQRLSRCQTGRRASLSGGCLDACVYVRACRACRSCCTCVRIVRSLLAVHAGVREGMRGVRAMRACRLGCRACCARLRAGMEGWGRLAWVQAGLRWCGSERGGDFSSLDQGPFPQMRPVWGGWRPVGRGFKIWGHEVRVPSGRSFCADSESGFSFYNFGLHQLLSGSYS